MVCLFLLIFFNFLFINCSQVEEKTQQAVTEPCAPTKQKKKIKLKNNIEEAMLCYQYWGPRYPAEFKLKVGEDIICEYKKSKNGENILETKSKEIELEDGKLLITHEYDWTVAGKCWRKDSKTQEFLIEPNVEIVELEFNWKQEKPVQHIVLKKQYRPETIKSINQELTKSGKKDKQLMLLKNESSND